MDLIQKYFPELSEKQLRQFEALGPLYQEWNAKINVISRKDIEELYLRHVLHSLGIAKVINFADDTSILDVGTGGGFPGVPLAILFPNCQFHLVDSINKKLKVINAVSEEIGLNNVRTTHTRVEVIDEKYDFIVSRAVTAMPQFKKWVNGKTKKKQSNTLKNGILYLKGGNLTDELKDFKSVKAYLLSDYFDEPFFQTKKVIHLPLKYNP
ncbi:16S rRNA (guanine(527)-N(7))-methyltransferase RsmG [Winogradskyella poriferorum]|uniref:16S rRNA (guanine(527)-N(7))-methyltransferase RsmG n=1 Tax=Winogradskyella poriferorum TaxID=307627 RepID=UPI003D64EBC0